MCGIAGVLNFTDKQSITRRTLEKMIYQVTHRGPDGYGFFLNKNIGMAHARLSIIDLEGGWQPIHNEDKTLWIAYNGEIFNYRELRAELEKRGHRFYTESDTEVIIHLYEEKKEKCLNELNGQFAIALYDTKEKTLFLARDRMGIRPLFYTLHQGAFYFASEIKSIFAANPNIPRKIHPEVLAEIFTFWAPEPRETIFNEILQLPPGHWAVINEQGEIRRQEYWDIPLCSTQTAPRFSEEEYAEQLRALLIDAVQLRLRADVPVGAYLSGGIDSSAITSLIHHYTDNPLKSFSVTFSDQVYDERHEQNKMVEYIKTEHHSVDCGYADISQAFPDVIWHTETPILRTAPAPLYLLSKLVRQNDYKVVLTGEGADEILGGYDIFKEAKIRAFINKMPASRLRPFLLKRLYPYLALSPTRSAAYARQFFNTDASPENDLFYAHRPRWNTTSRTKVFLQDHIIANASRDPVEKLLTTYRNKLEGLDFFSRAQYIESRLLLGNYLLSSQGDRMSMANSVEGRYPFLDHRVVEFACSIPPNLKMKVLNEKNILKKSMQNLLPPAIVNRKKQPYMAPDILSFFGESEPEYLGYYLSDQLLNEAGFFKPRAVAQLVAKCRKSQRQGFRENMAFVGILSTQIIYDRFIKNFQTDTPSCLTNVKVIS